MAILEIIEQPDKRLRQMSEEIQKIDDEIKQLAVDMAETMYAAPGIGLAAIQVGRPLRMLVCDISDPEAESQLLTLINPQIVEKEGKVVSEEGCLSVPGVYEEVSRAAGIEVEYTNLEGEKMGIACEGLMSICLQHEIDHLEGRLFIDHLSSLKRKLAKRKLERYKQERAEKNDESGGMAHAE